MKRCSFALLGVLLLTATPLIALQGGPKVKPPKPTVSSSKPVQSTTTKVKAVSVKPAVSKPTKPVQATKPVKATKPVNATKPAKTTAVKSANSTVKATKPAKTTKLAKAETKKSPTTTTPTTTTPTTTTPDPTTTPTPGDPVTLTKVQEKLQRNTNLANKLKDRLPPGTDLMLAAEGFTNLGKFVSAVNVSYNHPDIEFEALKTLIVDEGFSLGQAIQKIKGELNGTVEAQRAESDAQKIITASEGPTPSTTTATTSTTTAKTKKPKKPVGGQE